MPPTYIFIGEGPLTEGVRMCGHSSGGHWYVHTNWVLSGVYTYEHPSVSGPSRTRYYLASQNKKREGGREGGKEAVVRTATVMHVHSTMYIHGVYI